MAYELTASSVKKLAFEHAERHRFGHTFDSKKKIAG